VTLAWDIDLRSMGGQSARPYGSDLPSSELPFTVDDDDRLLTD